MAATIRRVVFFAIASNRSLVLRVPHYCPPTRYLSTVTPSVGVEQPDCQKPPIIDWTAPRDVLIRVKADSTRKTAAYIIPAVESLENQTRLAVNDALLESSSHIPSRSKVRYPLGPLILAPTRNSAVQIASDAQRLTVHRKGFEVQLLTVGADKAKQKEDWMKSSRDLVVATPGRLRDLLTNDFEFRLGFKGCPMLILDEVDTLLSMGFRDDIDAIVSFLPRFPLRQTILLSATMPRAVRQLASWMLSPDHAFVETTPQESGLTGYQNVEHSSSMEHMVPSGNEHMVHGRIEQFHTLCQTASDQFPTLLKLLAHDQLTHGSRSKVIIFCPTVQMAELFATLLQSLAEKLLPDNSTKVAKIHWKMKQSESSRIRAWFHKTQDGHPTVLIASDISATAVDYPGVTRMIQIGVPNKESVHLRRIRLMTRRVSSFILMENNQPIVRTDLLLLPWEAGYMNWKLTSLPIKPLPTSVLDSQLATLSPLSPILTTELLQSALAEIRHRTDPADVRHTAASLLGYYLPLTPPLRLQPHAVLAGVSSWAMECFHVSIPVITRLPRKFMEAYEQSVQSGKTKGLFVDGLRLAAPSPLGKVKSKNRSVWEGANVGKKMAKRWY